jgi:hypothetical protein
MGDLARSVALIFLGQVVSLVVKHFADAREGRQLAEQTRLMGEQTEYLREIARNTRPLIKG